MRDYVKKHYERSHRPTTLLLFPVIPVFPVVDISAGHEALVIHKRRRQMKLKGLKLAVAICAMLFCVTAQLQAQDAPKKP
jgi:hypothetical protein